MPKVLRSLWKKAKDDAKRKNNQQEFELKSAKGLGPKLDSLDTAIDKFKALKAVRGKESNANPYAEAIVKLVPGLDAIIDSYLHEAEDAAKKRPPLLQPAALASLKSTLASLKIDVNEADTAARKHLLPYNHEWVEARRKSMDDKIQRHEEIEKQMREADAM
jgi:hypothetical protein